MAAGVPFGPIFSEQPKSVEAFFPVAIQKYAILDNQGHIPPKHVKLQCIGEACIPCPENNNLDFGHQYALSA